MKYILEKIFKIYVNISALLKLIGSLINNLYIQTLSMFLSIFLIFIKKIIKL